ncbi:MAG: aminoacetone oxidase family FAD-binding enzyme [Prevotella sp.]|nr:aminoacetone oxidase family FAD-binding enzyme [Prevotella sp.]
MRTAIIGGGAAGFFLAINLKEMMPAMDVVIIESAQKVLRKVAVSGGGRCNVTNTFEGIRDLKEVYPRGHRLLGRLFRTFSPQDTWQWLEHRGVRLTAQPDHCVFPMSQDAHTIINLFLAEARRLGVTVKTGCRITTLDETADYDNVCVTTGGQPHAENLHWLGQDIVEPVPSLFTLSIADPSLNALTGTVIPCATAFIPGTKLRADGPLLLTHWGMSGPAILRLSSYAARHLAECGYQSPLMVNWASVTEAEATQAIGGLAKQCAQKMLTTVAPLQLPQRLWVYLCEKALGQRAHAPWGSMNAKEQRRLVNVLVAYEYRTSGRAPHRDEFVTCGGVSLSAVNANTLESRTRPGLYFAGEVLDIDGVTGGFNFQAAWTTAFTVASAIATKAGADFLLP